MSEQQKITRLKVLSAVEAGLIMLLFCSMLGVWHLAQAHPAVTLTPVLSSSEHAVTLPTQVKGTIDTKLSPAPRPTTTPLQHI